VTPEGVFAADRPEFRMAGRQAVGTGLRQIDWLTGELDPVALV
jgi:hypothetical protein